MEDDNSALQSSYGVMTAERILERYSLPLSREDITVALKNNHSFYHQLLKIPFKNVLNGIIIQQVYDYYVFAQKLFIDYLLSGEGGKEEGSPGTSTRKHLEEERQLLLTLGERYQDIQTEQDKIIAKTQSYLINYVSKFLSAKAQGMENSAYLLSEDERKALEISVSRSLIYNDYNNFTHNLSEALGIRNPEVKVALTEAFEEFTKQIEILNAGISSHIENGKYMAKKATDLRTQFYELILRVKAMITQLPEYTHDEDQERKNKEALYFDSSIE